MARTEKRQSLRRRTVFWSLDAAVAEADHLFFLCWDRRVTKSLMSLSQRKSFRCHSQPKGV